MGLILKLINYANLSNRVIRYGQIEYRLEIFELALKF